MSLPCPNRVPAIAIALCLSVGACHETAQPTQMPATSPAVVTPISSNGVAGASPTSSPPTTTVGAVNAGTCPKQTMLDDFEDADSAVLALDQRSGVWSTFTDKIGSTILPDSSTELPMESPGSEGSKHALRIHGKTAAYGNVYAGVGFWFTRDTAPYDASCCQGIAFRAKRAKGSIDSVRLKVGDTNTLPEGNVCKNCYNDFGVDLGFGEEWKPYRIRFENMHQSTGWGDQFPQITPARLLQVQWQVNHPGFDFDIWLDDIQLLDCVAPT